MKRTLTSFLLILCFAALGLASACGGGSSDSEEESTDPFNQPAPEPIANAQPLPPPTSLICPKGTALTYDNFGEAFFLNYCTMCHSSKLADAQRAGAPADSNFDTPQDVALWRALILKTTAGNTATMPPAQNIPSDIKYQLAEWLNCGAPGGSVKIK